MTDTDRLAPPKQLVDTGLVAILRAPSAARFPEIAETLAEAGMTCVEFTLNSPGCLDALRAARERLPDTVALGAGTALTPEQVRQAHGAGAGFVVSPHVDPEVIACATELGLPCFPGAFTATEVLAAWRAGAAAVKVFPASAVGPAYLAYLRGPLAEVPMLPTGGVELEQIGAYLRAGAIGVGLGGPLLGGAMSEGATSEGATSEGATSEGAPEDRAMSKAAMSGGVLPGGGIAAGELAALTERAQRALAAAAAARREPDALA